LPLSPRSHRLDLLSQRRGIGVEQFEPARLICRLRDRFGELGGASATVSEGERSNRKRNGVAVISDAWGMM
jgi:hypothetical protein